MEADLIAVDENPLEKIDSLKSVRMVMRGGKIVERPR
jgi:imidazolonepropionase-like amidohydrolase